MVQDLELPINIRMLPIIRTKEGLALSSRNQYLTENDLKEALHLPNSLVKIEQLILNRADFISFRDSLLKDETYGDRWDYCEILDTKSFTPMTPHSLEVVIVAAFRCKNTRLLDNRIVNLSILRN